MDSLGERYIIIDSGYSGDLAIPVEVPVAWMLSSNGTYVTMKYFLLLIKAQSLNILPSIYMTDCNLR